MSNPPGLQPMGTVTGIIWPFACTLNTEPGIMPAGTWTYGLRRGRRHCDWCGLRVYRLWLPIYWLGRGVWLLGQRLRAASVAYCCWGGASAAYGCWGGASAATISPWSTTSPCIFQEQGTGSLLVPKPMFQSPGLARAAFWVPKPPKDARASGCKTLERQARSARAHGWYTRP